MTNSLNKLLPEIEKADKEKIVVRIEIDPITASAVDTLNKALSKNSLNRRKRYLFKIFGEKGL